VNKLKYIRVHIQLLVSKF